MSTTPATAAAGQATLAPVAILLDSDGYSPMAGPSKLPALHYKRALTHLIDDARASDKDDGDQRPSQKLKAAAERIEAHLKARGWESTWRYTMYKHAHFHSTTHELLTPYIGTATIQLGGFSSHPKSPPTSTTQVTPPPLLPAADQTTQATLHVGPGDLLLLPAGYTHHLVDSTPAFCMVGSYPEGSAPWDMRFPATTNPAECTECAAQIEANLLTRARKGLFDARDPADVYGANALEYHWQVPPV